MSTNSWREIAETTGMTVRGRTKKCKKLPRTSLSFVCFGAGTASKVPGHDRKVINTEKPHTSTSGGSCRGLHKDSAVSQLVRLHKLRKHACLFSLAWVQGARHTATT